MYAGEDFPVLPEPPRRVISLVPSLTESLFDLGLGDRLIGITDYCIYPELGVRSLPRLGGTKNPDVEAIIRSQPDLVLANQEENTPAAVQALRAAGIPVWLTFPHTVEDTMVMLLELAAGFQYPAASVPVRILEMALGWARISSQNNPQIRYFCPIWQDGTGDSPAWWMTFNDDTYCADVLAHFGCENVFGARQRRYPLAADLGLAGAEPAGERDTRYPRVALEEIRAAQPQLILLPSEPFAFGDDHLRVMQNLFAETPAAQAGRILRIDGTLITWCGTRLGRALETLPEVLSRE